MLKEREDEEIYNWISNFYNNPKWTQTVEPYTIYNLCWEWDLVYSYWYVIYVDNRERLKMSFVSLDEQEFKYEH